MADVLTTVYLFYMFIALYFVFLFMLTFFQNRKDLFYNPKSRISPSISVAIPAFNEEASLESTVKSVLSSDYGNILEVIVINDGSSDRTKEIAVELEKKYSKVVFLDKSNSGKADSLNQAMKIAKGELFVVVDADSYPSKNAISKMVSFFEDSLVSAVTTRVLVRDSDKFIRRLQAIEYKVIAFTRSLLSFLDAIYVTPGPLAMYRKSALKDIGGFDTENMTEDIEITWRLVFNRYKVRMAFEPYVTTVAPDTFRGWVRQRIRWNIGGLQTMMKYKQYFFRRGMLGFFILPFFTFSLLLGVVGLSIFSYRIFQRVLVYYLTTTQAMTSEVAVIVLSEINLNPSVLHFFGITLFVLGLSFVFFSLYMVNKNFYQKESFINVFFYSLFYALVRPFVLMVAVYKYFRGNYEW